MNLSEIKTLIDKANQYYYRTNNPIMSDEEYDSLIAELRSLEPDDERLSRVGIPYTTAELRNKVKHPIPMGSLDNTEDGILGYRKWYDNICQGSDAVSICASLKIDGSSIRLCYKNGKLIEAATRGNGEFGENITANVANFKWVPTVLPLDIDIDVRGEAILYIDDYKDIRSAENGVLFDEIPEKERSNPRNIGNGIIGRDDGVNSHKMRFMAFNVENGPKFETEQEKFNFLNSIGFNVVPHRICESPHEVEQFYNSVVGRRDTLPFEIDGVVVTINSLDRQLSYVTNDTKTRLRPKYARAIKFPHKSNTTIIRDVKLSIGHTRAIIPTALLDEVRIGGVNVTHALLNNWDEIARLNIAIGDEVEVILAGDIIPKIIRVVNHGANREIIKEPEFCHSCGSPTTRKNRGKDGAVTYCTNASCSEAMLQKINHWIGSSKKGVGILGIGDVILRTLWTNKIISDPADLYTITVDGIKNLSMPGGIRIGESRAIEIVNNISSKKCLPLHVFLGSLGIELLGRRRVQIMQEAANGELDNLNDWLDDQKLSSIQIDGFGDAIRSSIRDGINENRGLIMKMLNVGVTIQYQEKQNEEIANDAGVMSGVSFCFTGTRECIDEVRSLGASITSGVAKSKPSPDFLVQKDPLSQSNKTKNAEANGHTRIISLDFLKRVLAGKANLDSAMFSVATTSTSESKGKIDTKTLALELMND